MKHSIRAGTFAALACLLLAAAPASVAHAARALLSEAALETAHCEHCADVPKGTLPPPDGQLEGPCGVAISASGQVYVADYYHRAIDVFRSPSASSPGQYGSQIALSGTNPRFGVNALGAICGLAFDAAGNLYGNEWHQGVLRLTGGEAEIDGGDSTGLAIDPSTNRLYVDDRTSIAEYALPFSPGDVPLARIGVGSLGEGFGLAAGDGRVYVADAGDQTVKVFAPATSATAPVATLSGQFHSLTDAALAIDPTNGHLLVVDNLQPGYEHPRSAVLEFDSPNHGYVFLGSLPGAPIDGGPSGIAVDSAGRAIVTDGNGELANAFLYGPFQEGASFVAGFAPPVAESSSPTAGADSARAPRQRAAFATSSELSQHGGVRVAFEGKLAPRTLPRRGQRPIVATVGARITAAAGGDAPQLQQIEIAVNRNAHFAPASLPVCQMRQIQPATTAAALAACGRSLVGEGAFSARVLLPGQAPFPSAGKIYAFNGRWHGQPAILAHVYGTQPVPVSYTIPFQMLFGIPPGVRSRRGTYGTFLSASLPAVTGSSGYITGLSLSFGRGPGSHGYLTAGCPLPAGLSSASFPFADARFSFATGTVGAVLVRRCKARG